MSPPQQYFEPIVRKQRRNRRIAAIAMLLLSVAAVVWSLSLDHTQYPIARMGALAIIGIPVALLILVLGFLPHKGLTALADPSRIVWYYGVEKSGHVNAVMIGFDDGKLVRFELPLVSIKEGFSQEALQLLQVAAPGATRGFSEEHRLAFKEAPPSLKSPVPR
jgi:hypothetical protein